MKFHHQELANGRWKQLSFMEQLANVGSEVERTLKWQEKGNQEMSINAFYRALELLELTLQSADSLARRREVARIKETWVDFIVGENNFNSSAQQWRKYFYSFNYAARNK